MINGAQQKQGRGQSRLAFGGVPRAAGQNRQPFTKGGVEPFHVSGVDEQATMRVEQLLHDKGWRPAQDTPGQGQDSCTILSSLLDDTGDSEGFPDLQLATSPRALVRHLVPKGPQNGLRLGSPASGNDQQGAAGASRPADASQPVDLDFRQGHADRAITVHLPEVLAGVLHAEAIMTQTSVSALVRAWIEDHLDLPESHAA